MRLVFQTPERTRMNYSVAVALEFVPVEMAEFRIPASEPLTNGEPQAAKGIVRQDKKPTLPLAVGGRQEQPEFPTAH